MFFGNSHVRTRTSWRLLSPLAALLWVVALIGFAGVANADSTDPAVPQAAGHAQDHATSSDSQAANSSAHTSATGQASGQPQGQGQDNAKRQDDTHPAGSGDLTSPQPISNADANTGGANGQCPDGPYCSTRDGSPSANGSGNGKATGEPCAGCVGKADNKNPQGQMPNGSDANAGYECDTNHGIGQTNPAHTGCTVPEQDCVPTPGHPCVPPCVDTPGHPCVPPCVDTPGHPCVSSPPCVDTPTAPCQTTPLISPPLAGSTVVSPPTGAQAAAPTAAQALPNTGAPADLPWLAGAALASIMAGIVLLTTRRKQVGS